MDAWEKIARKLPCGRTVRTKCCKDDQSLVISHTEKGYSAFCFRCGKDSSKFVPHGARSTEEILRHRRELESYLSDRSTLYLPSDFKVMHKDVPSEAWLWFLKSGVSSLLCETYGFGYSESLGRVVLPVRSPKGDLLAVQSRAIYKDQVPKYVTRTSGVPNVYFESDDDLLLTQEFKNSLVITEDILSSARVGRVIPSLSTLGTYLSDKVVVRSAMEQREHVYIWYDGDQAGVDGSHKAKKVLDLMGVPNTIIETKLDPKEYSNDKITQIVKSVENHV
jgi:hypothetical protein